MAHRVSRQAEAELDAIWYYIAKESGSIEIADRMVDSITERFFLLSRSPTSDAAAMRISTTPETLYNYASFLKMANRRGEAREGVQKLPAKERPLPPSLQRRERPAFPQMKAPLGALATPER